MRIDLPFNVEMKKKNNNIGMSKDHYSQVDVTHGNKTSMKWHAIFYRELCSEFNCLPSDMNFNDLKLQSFTNMNMFCCYAV